MSDNILNCANVYQYLFYANMKTYSVSTQQFWFGLISSFTALQHILGHFGHGQLT